MKNEIKNAPTVSASYVRFVINNFNMGKTANLVEEHKTLKRKCEVLEDTVKDLKKSIDTSEMSKAIVKQETSDGGSGGGGGGRGKRKKDKNKDQEGAQE